MRFDKRYVDRYTGIEISDDQVLSTLRSLGFGAEYDGMEFRVTVPSWRATKDVTIKADIIEEITRIYGYDNFEIATTLSPLYPRKKSAANKSDNFAKDILVERYGLHEVHSYIWFDAKKCRELGIAVEENVKLLSPQSPDHETLRTNMGPTLLSFVQENRSFAADFGLFEIAECVKERGKRRMRGAQGPWHCALQQNAERKGAVFPAVGDRKDLGQRDQAHRAFPGTSGACSCLAAPRKYGGNFLPRGNARLALHGAPLCAFQP